jgi:hypothetical protein
MRLSFRQSGSLQSERPSWSLFQTRSQTISVRRGGRWCRICEDQGEESEIIGGLVAHLSMPSKHWRPVSWFWDIAAPKRSVVIIASLCVVRPMI